MRRGSPDLHFNPRPPRGERRRRSPSGRCCGYFNPRPPRGERRKYRYLTFEDRKFQSTPSARRATAEVCGADRRICISIHALREESDSVIHLDRPRFIVFQSTPSARRATSTKSHTTKRKGISIHALREESDLPCHRWRFRGFPISIHALREESDAGRDKSRPVFRISIHALREESDS